MGKFEDFTDSYFDTTFEGMDILIACFKNMLLMFTAVITVPLWVLGKIRSGAKGF